MASAILLCPIGSVAQNNDSDKKQIVEVAAGVKIYYPAKMGFSLNEPVENVTNMITMYNQHSDFTLMVNGENYLQSRESFLAHTLVADVERIEIITDPSICGNNIGTDGNINIVLRKIDEGVHGYGGLQYTMNNGDFSKEKLCPFFSLSNKTGNWSVWFGGLMNYKSNRYEFVGVKDDYSYPYISKLNYDVVRTVKTVETGIETKQYSLDVGANYKDAIDDVTVRLSYYYSPVISLESFYQKSVGFKHISDIDDWHNEEDSFYSEYRLTDTNSKIHHTTASFDWKHVFNDKLSLKTTLGKEWLKQNDNNKFITHIDRGSYAYPMSLSDYNMDHSYSYNDPSTKVSSTLFDVCADYQPMRKLNIRGGVEFNWMDVTTPDTGIGLSSDENKISQYMPYLFVQYSVGQFTLSAGERLSFNDFKYRDYNCANYNSTMTEDSVIVKNIDKSFNTSITSASIAWMPNANHKVMAAWKHHKDLSHSFERGNYQQSTTEEYQQGIYYYYYDVITIQKEKSHDVFDLSYAYCGKNISAGINAKYVNKDYEEGSYVEPSKVFNHTVSLTDYYSVSASAMYTYSIFSLAADVDYYKNNYETLPTSGAIIEKGSSRNMWAVRLTPMVTLPYGFNLSASAAVLSTRQTHPLISEITGRRKDKWLTVRASKQFGGAELYVKWENAFDKREEDHVRYDKGETSSEGITSTNNYANRVTIGGSIRF